MGAVQNSVYRLAMVSVSSGSVACNQCYGSLHYALGVPPHGSVRLVIPDADVHVVFAHLQ